MAVGWGGARRGAGRKRAAVPKAMIDNATPEVLEAVIEQAKQGNLQAAALILSRGLRPLKAAHEPVRILTAAQLADMSAAQRADAVNVATMAGKLPPDVGQAILAGIQSQCAIVESSELAERVAQLEALADAEERGVQRV